jgi:endonuclease/exonuclease/phosphatase family metal-dependent hydrolase
MSNLIKNKKKVLCAVLIVVMMLVLVYWVPQKINAATNYTTGSLRIMSANLRTTTGINLIDGSNNRATNFATFMGCYQPDSIGLQEVSKVATSGQSWNAWFNDNIGTGNLSNYAITGKKSDYETDLYGDSKEYCLILYNKTKYTLEKSGGIWIGKNPASSSLSDVFTSTDSSGSTIAMKHSRVLSWALLKNTSTGASYLHVNCHLDTRLAGGIGLMQTEAIIKKVQDLVSLYEVPVVLTGDFNYDEYTNDRTAFNDYYKLLTNVMSYDGVTSGLVDGKYATTDCSTIGTSCGYASNYNKTLLNVIDRVCFMNTSKMLSLTSMSNYSYSVSKSRVVSTYTFGGVNYDTRYISDHSPVYTELAFNYTK